MANRLDGKTTAVFGGAGRIGSAVAFAHAGEGASVIVIDRNEDKLENVKQQLKTAGYKCFSHICADIQCSEDIKSMVHSLKRLTDSIDVLVNCPAYISRAPFLTHSIEEVDKQWHVNVRSVFMVSQAVAKNFMVDKGGGKIINLASVGGQFPEREHSGHCTVKAAIIALSRVMALELAAYNIQVNVVAPGPTETVPFSSSFYAKHPEILSKIENKTPSGRIGHPEDHVGLMVFLASKESDWITGQVIFSDGGLSLV